MRRPSTLNVVRSNKRKWPYTKKARNIQYSAETITHADYPDDIALLAKTPIPAEPLQHSLEQPAGSISRHVNVNKTEYTRFKQERAISTVNSDPLKLVDKFTYLSNSDSSTESEVDMRLAKALAGIDWLSII